GPSQPVVFALPAAPPAETATPLKPPSTASSIKTVVARPRSNSAGPRARPGKRGADNLGWWPWIAVVSLLGLSLAMALIVLFNLGPPTDQAGTKQPPPHKRELDHEKEKSVEKGKKPD